MSAAENLLADPVETLTRMVRAEAERELKRHGDRFYVQRVAAAFHERASACGCQHNTCGGCRVCLAVAAVLESTP